MYREFATTTTKACTDLPAKCYESFHTAWHSATHKYSPDSLLSHLQILYNPMRNADDVMCLAICFLFSPICRKCYKFYQYTRRWQLTVTVKMLRGKELALVQFSKFFKKLVNLPTWQYIPRNEFFAIKFGKLLYVLLNCIIEELALVLPPKFFKSKFSKLISLKYLKSLMRLIRVDIFTMI